MIEEDEGYFDYKHAMKMILYDGSVNVDSKIYSTKEFLDEVRQDQLC